MGGCMPSVYSHRGKPPLQMHTVVEQPLTLDEVGRVSCRPVGMEPITFEWQPAHDLVLDPSGSEATNVRCGRYRVIATDATDARADVVVDVEPLVDDAVVVLEYRTTPASTSRARDGSVEAVGYGLEGWRFLWTHGVETTTPHLQDAASGTYALHALTTDERQPLMVHKCPPARVEVRR